MSEGVKMLKTALDEVQALSISLIRRCKSEDDAMVIATALAFEAEMIWTELGGSRHAAAQFYHLADKCAAMEES